ncbi:unnamed protein product [Cunninghamella blakesleeana]
MIYHSHIITLMQEYLNQQNEINQGEILYVLHILLNMIATVLKSNTDLKKSNDHLQNDLNEIMNRFTSSLTVHPLQDIFDLWQSPSLPKLELTYVTDADQILNVLYKILSQQRDLHHDNVKDIFGSVSISISRFILTLMLHSGHLVFDQVIKLFSLFWLPFDEKHTLNTNNLQSKHLISRHNDDNNQQLLNHSNDNNNDNDNTVQYIIRSFELVLKQSILSEDENNEEKKILPRIFKFYHNDVFNKVEDVFQVQFCDMMCTIHWYSLSLYSNDDNDFFDILWKSVLCLVSNKNKYKKRNVGYYLKFVYTFIQQTALFQIKTSGGSGSGNNNKELKDIMNQQQLINFIKLTFTILIYADSIWVNNNNYLQKVELLWIPISSSMNSIHYSADDVHDIISSTQINSTFNWISTLDDVMDNQLDHSDTNDKDDHRKANNNSLSLCVKWMEHLTINHIGNDFDKTMEYGYFILPLFSSIQNKKSLRYWLKYLLDQTDSSSIDNINSIQFIQLQKHIIWFQTIVNTLLKDSNIHGKCIDDEFKTTTFNTLYEFISTSQPNTTLAFFMAILPLVLNNSSKKSHMTITHKKLLLMESCLERYIHFSKDHNESWVYIGSMIYEQTAYNNNNNNNNNNNLEDDINHCIQYCMEQSLFLVIRTFCERKLQKIRNTSNQNQNKDNNKYNNEDYHISEEVAAIISLIHLQPEMMTDFKQILKFVELVQFYTLLFSKYKNQEDLDLWMPSLVSLSKTFTRWNAIETSDFYEQQFHQHHHDHHQESSGKNHKNNNGNNHFWRLFIKLLNIYLVTRLAQSDVPSFKNDDKTNSSWIKELNHLKSDKSYKHLEKLISFGVEVITDNDHWTLWDLHKFIERIMELVSF